MSLISASHDSLPYIDPPPPADLLRLVNSLIASELDPRHATHPHPSLPATPPQSLSPTLESELARVAAGTPLRGAIDLSRYEAATDGDGGGTALLRAAYASAEHVSTRLANLTLLAEFGKNAWLVHNSQLEAMLKTLEEELVAVKGECELVNKERKGMQVAVETELERLAERWRTGVGRVLEVEAAAEVVRLEVLKKRREGVGR